MYYKKKPNDTKLLRNISNFYAFGEAGISVHFTRVSFKPSNYFIAIVSRKLKEGYKSILLQVIFFLILSVDFNVREILHGDAMPVSALLFIKRHELPAQRLVLNFLQVLLHLTGGLDHTYIPIIINIS
jgi:hypothetical protein